MNNNMARLKDIAVVLGDIRDHVVFVGGATVGLYIDDKAAPTHQKISTALLKLQLTENGQILKRNLEGKGFRTLILREKIQILPLAESTF